MAQVAGLHNGLPTAKLPWNYQTTNPSFGLIVQAKSDELRRQWIKGGILW